MTRIVKAHAVRRDEILDLAQRLLLAKGYEQMTIQDVLDGLQIAKGTFYHYFGSKQALLEALIERMGAEQEQLLRAVALDPALPALDRLNRFFAALAGWKTAQQTVILALLRVWHADDNALVRQKARAAVVRRNGPLLAAIVRQGLQEGVMTIPDPDHSGEIVMSFVLDLSDRVAGVLLSGRQPREALQRLRGIVTAYTGALERVLGVPAGSVHLVDVDTLAAWLVPPPAEQAQEEERWPRL